MRSIRQRVARASVARAFAALALAAACTAAVGSSATAASGGGGDAAAARQPAAVAPDWQARMLDRINALRSQAGVAPLRLCAPLIAAAEMHARAMATTGVFSHAGAAGDQLRDRMASVGYLMRTAGENIAAGQATPRDAMKAWRGSAAHYDVLTSPRFRHVGLAVAAATTGEYPVYWVQDFAAGGRC